MPAPCVTFTSDFGTADGYVGAVKGVLVSLCPGVRVVDLAHDVEAGDVTGGAVALMVAARTFPTGCVHLAVVDPGVGTERAGVLVESAGSYYVGPDNGLLSLAAPAPRRIWRLDVAQWFRHPVQPTFHGRDVFAPIAAHAAAGVEPGRLGTPASAMVDILIEPAVRSGGVLTGEVLHSDRFGNLLTTIRAEDLPTDRDGLRVSVANAVPFAIRDTYGDPAHAAPPRLVAVVGAAGFLEISVVGGSARELLGAAGARGAAVQVHAA